uniref:Acyltransferase PGAP2 n=1 Tax=Sparus aurata TaxID=8175 RepID=A0A671Y3R2_SPAAU
MPAVRVQQTLAINTWPHPHTQTRNTHTKHTHTHTLGPLEPCLFWNYVNPEERTSYHWKLRLFLFNIGCCLAVTYFFRRHNMFCETGVYTLFAFFEYPVVFSNMAFPMTAFWDFGSKDVIVATVPEDKRY